MDARALLDQYLSDPALLANLMPKETRGPEIAGGIPVGSDPRLPMSQEDFSEMVHRLMDRNKSIPGALRQYGVNSIIEGIQKGIFRAPPGV